MILELTYGRDSGLSILSYLEMIRTTFLSECIKVDLGILRHTVFGFWHYCDDNLIYLEMIF